MSKLLTVILTASLAAASQKPVALLAGLGTWRHPIATQNPEA